MRLPDANSQAEISERRRCAITVTGVVQGVGFRPFVYCVATDHSLSGFIQNESSHVRIEVEGHEDDVHQFLVRLESESPPQATIHSLKVESHPPQAVGADATLGFEIRKSDGTTGPKPVLPADLAICSECLADLRDPEDRRYGYAFTNCTNCGPRWSIVHQLPYDRPHTSMRSFALCDQCQVEYDDPSDRRFHAQPIACPECGPSLKLHEDHFLEANPQEAIRCAGLAILEGRILAFKGIGGFQLLCDATNSQAIARLRKRKHRPDKPLAVMVPTLEEARRHCILSEKEALLIASAAAPILLVRRRGDAEKESRIATEVAPGNPWVGLMLPTTPLHYLLMDELNRPVVCTSGNLSEEPMAIDAQDAVARLDRIADLTLTHDRPIVRPVDDSIARIGPQGITLLRRARGYAPRPIALKSDCEQILALGGHLKNAVALGLGSTAIMSPHVGDLDNRRSVDRHCQTIEDMVDFFKVRPKIIACDLHPDYASTRHAERLASKWGASLVRVQHHHAHVASVMAEHHLTGPILGLAWDGTGYGPDQTAWGGEALLCQEADYRRVSHLRSFPLPGGERAARQPRLAALGLLYEIDPRLAEQEAPRWFQPSEFQPLLQGLAGGRLFHRTSSMGRLFDAVAALVDLRSTSSFEGQAAMELEFTVAEDVEDGYPLPILPGEDLIVNWAPMIRQTLQDRQEGVETAVIAAKFHNTWANMALTVAQRVGCSGVALTGGCFQNSVLLNRVCQMLSHAGYHVYTNHAVPPGDGGVALGQLVVAARQTNGAASCA